MADGSLDGRVVEAQKVKILGVAGSTILTEEETEDDDALVGGGAAESLVYHWQTDAKTVGASDAGLNAQKLQLSHIPLQYSPKMFWGGAYLPQTSWSLDADTNVVSFSDPEHRYKKNRKLTARYVWVDADIPDPDQTCPNILTDFENYAEGQNLDLDINTGPSKDETIIYGKATYMDHSKVLQVRDDTDSCWCEHHIFDPTRTDSHEWEISNWSQVDFKLLERDYPSSGSSIALQANGTIDVAGTHGVIVGSGNVLADNDDATYIENSDENYFGYTVGLEPLTGYTPGDSINLHFRVSVSGGGDPLDVEAEIFIATSGGVANSSDEIGGFGTGVLSDPWAFPIPANDGSIVDVVVPLGVGAGTTWPDTSVEDIVAALEAGAFLDVN